MNFFEKLFPKQEREPSVKDLHKDFKITHDGFWYFNREFNFITDRGISLKAKVFFENPSLLDECEFLAKIGKNLEIQIPFPYIGFAYGREEKRESLEEWAKKFPHAELIIGLDDEGVITKDSKVVVLKTENK